MQPAICTQCGANIEINETKNSTICSYCGTAFVRGNENNNITNNRNVQTANASVGNLIKRAEQYKDEGNLDKAKEYYNKVLDIDVNNQKALNGLKAIDDYIKVKNYIKIATQYFTEGNVDKAEEYYKKALDIDINNQKAIDGLNEILFKKATQCKIIGDLDTAREYYNKVLELDSNNPKAEECIKSIADYPGGIKGLYITYSQKDKLDNLLSNSKKFSATRYVYKIAGITFKEAKFFIAHYETHKNFNINLRDAPPKKSGCYIATAVYGSYDCPEVFTLRRFRDNALTKTFAGRVFIKVYYAISPKLVKLFGKTKLFNCIWKNVLDLLVRKLQLNGYQSLPYKDKT
jgi:tetratricopeptide (TPR) repeat protein